MIQRTVSIALIALTTLVQAACGGVITVNGAGGASFTEIQPAIDAAADGDVIVVAAGDYSKSTSTGGLVGVSVDGKGLTLVADPAGASIKTSFLSVKNVSTGQRVIVRGFDVAEGSSPTPGFAGTLVSSCNGAVMFEDCSMKGFPGLVFFNTVFPGQPAVTVVNVASATLIRCTMTGGMGVPKPVGGAPGAGGPGLLVQGSSVAAYDSVATGGLNWAWLTTGGGQAGPGVQVGPGQLVSSGCTFIGGSALQAGSGTGGSGLLLKSSESVASLTDTVTAGGADVSGGAQPINVQSGVVSTLPGTARSLAVSSPVQPGSLVMGTIYGEQNDVVLFFASQSGGFWSIAGLQGVLTFGLPVQGAFLLTAITTPSGQDSFVAPAPPLVPGVAGLSVVLHPVFLNGADAFAGSPTAFTLVQ
jgi:hypothetical protein